jgi:hypothetical protein
MHKQEDIIQILDLMMTTYLSGLVDECFNRRLVFKRVQIVPRYSAICFYMLKRQTSFKSFSSIALIPATAK